MNKAVKCKQKDKILLFIPGYNCEKQIPRVLDKIDEEIARYFDEIIFVNNRSTDNTEDIVLNYKPKSFMPRIKVLRNDHNYNLGGSHKVAFSYALNNGFDYVVVLHGDDQGDIRDLKPILKSGEYENYDAMLGARFMKGSKLGGYSKFRTFGNRVYNHLFSMVVHRKIYDLGSGLNIYDVRALESKYYHKFIFLHHEEAYIHNIHAGMHIPGIQPDETCCGGTVINIHEDSSGLRICHGNAGTDGNRGGNHR